MEKDFFIVSLENNKVLNSESIDNRSYEYDEEYDNLTSVFHDLSNVLCDKGNEFVLKLKNGIIGTTRWELSIFLEYFYSLSKFIVNKEIKTYDLRFYEQTARCLFSFEKIDHQSYKLKFTDLDLQGDQPIYGEGSLLDISLSLYTFYSRVCFLTEKLCPSIATNKMFIDWRKSVKVLYRF